MYNHSLSKRFGALTLSCLSLLAGCGPAPIGGQPGTTPSSNPGSANPPSAIVTPGPGVSLPPTVIVTPGPGGSTPIPGSTVSPIPGSTPVPIVSVTPIPGQSVAAGQLNILSNVLATGVRDFNYSHLLQATGGVAPYRWQQISGQIPSGLSLDTSTGQIIGRPTQVGTFNFDVQVIDSQLNTVRRTFSLTVSESSSSNSLSVLTSSLSSAVKDSSYSATLEPSGGSGPFSWSLRSGSLPSGLSLSSSGEVRGTPTSTGEETFTVQVTDSRGQTATRSLSITTNSTNSNISIVTASLPGAVNGTAYQECTCGASCTNVNLQATGGNNSFTWTISSGTLPSGLSLSSTSGTTIQITGTPTTTGASTFTVQAKDSNGNAASRVFTINVGSALIKSFTPTGGGQGLNVKVTGLGFDSTAANNSIQFGTGTAATASAITTADGAGCRTLTVPVPNTGALSGALTLSKSTVVANTSTSNFTVQEVVINEVHTNRDNTTNQFIELRNNSASPVDVANWILYYTGTDGNVKSYTIPGTTPALLAGGFITIYINASGANTANTLYTGGATEIRFSTTLPNEAFLCTNANCSTGADLGTYRDYVQFGAAGAANQANAVSAGIWTTGQFVDVTNLTTNINAANTDNGTTNGIRITDSENAKFAVADQVVVDNSAVGGKVTNLLRTVAAVTGAVPARVKVNTTLLSATVSGANTGNGTTGNGVTVDNNAVFNVADLVTVVTGNLQKTVAALPTGKVELNTAVAATIQAGNVDDGTNTGGFLVDDSSLFTVGNTVTINGQSRTVASLPDATHVRINTAVATATISAANTGDGINSGITVTTTSTGVFDVATSKVLLGATGAPINLAAGTSNTSIMLAAALKTTTTSGTNTGSGADTGANGFTVANATGFASGDAVLINGFAKTLAGTPAGNNVSFTVPIVQTIDATNVGDGSVGVPIKFTTDMSTGSNNTGFATGNNVFIAGQAKTITLSGFGVVLNTPLQTTTVNGANTGTGTAGNGVLVANSGVFVVGDKIRFTANNDVRTITAIPDATHIECAATTGTVTTGSINLVPVSGTMVLRSGTMTFVPKTSSFTWVPVTGAINFIPTSGTISLIPVTGTIRQYKSIKYGGNNLAGTYTITTTPNAGS